MSASNEQFPSTPEIRADAMARALAGASGTEHGSNLAWVALTPIRHLLAPLSAIAVAHLDGMGPDITPDIWDMLARGVPGALAGAQEEIGDLIEAARAGRESRRATTDLAILNGYSFDTPTRPVGPSLQAATNALAPFGLAARLAAEGDGTDLALESGYEVDALRAAVRALEIAVMEVTTLCDYGHALISDLLPHVPAEAQAPLKTLRAALTPRQLGGKGGGAW